MQQAKKGNYSVLLRRRKNVLRLPHHSASNVSTFYIVGTKGDMVKAQVSLQPMNTRSTYEQT